MNRSLGSCLVVLGLALAPCAAFADFPGDTPDRFRFSIGGTVSEINSSSGVTLADQGVGTTVSFEDMVNLPGSKSAARADGFWRFGKKHYLDFGYVKFDRSGTALANQDVAWGDYVFKTDTSLTGKFNVSFLYAAYRYDFLQLDQVRISGSAGISYVNFDVGLGGQGEVVGPDGPVNGSFDEAVSVGVPVPLVGLQLNWALSKKLELQFHSRVFYLDLPKFAGGMSDGGVRFNWWFNRRFAVGLGATSTNINLKNYETGNKKLKFDYSVRGLDLMLTAAF